MRYIDLTHTFVDNMPVFPGDPAATLKQIASVGKEGFTDHKLTTGMHVGTHIDAPLHMLEGGKYISDISLGHFAGPGVLLDVRGQRVISIDILKDKTIFPKSIVFLYTGMDTKYGSDAYAKIYPAITQEFAHTMVSSGASILGMDMISPDVDESFPIHKILLSKNILIIENLTNLVELVGVPAFEVFAFPTKLHADAAAVRVVARTG